MKRIKIKTIPTKRFEREYKKLTRYNKILRNKIQEKTLALESDPFDKTLKTRKVDLPEFGLVYSSRVNGDIRIIWDFEGDIIILLLTIGGHDYVY